MNTSKWILIVDDEPGQRLLMSKRLKAAGFRIVMAQNAQEALVALWEKSQISLVLLDVRLPVINGLNIFEIIRKDFPDKKVIITSVLQRQEQRFLIYDADDYYDKSEDLSKLVALADNVIYQRTRGKLRENEKRLFRRRAVNLLASFERGAYPSEVVHFLAYTKDLSPYGGKFIINENICKGEHFTMALELPVNFLPLLIDCEVIWVKQVEDFDARTKGNVEAGLKFVRLDSLRDEEKLKNYLSYV